MRTLLTLGTLAGISPIISGLQKGTIDALSWLSIACGLIGLIGLPLLGLPRRIEILNEWLGKWIDIRRFYHESFQAQGNQRTSKHRGGKDLETGIEKDCRHFTHAFTGTNRLRAQTRAADWFNVMGLT